MTIRGVCLCLEKKGKKWKPISQASLSKGLKVKALKVSTAMTQKWQHSIRSIKGQSELLYTALLHTHNPRSVKNQSDKRPQHVADEYLNAKSRIYTATAGLTMHALIVVSMNTSYAEVFILPGLVGRHYYSRQGTVLFVMSYVKIDNFFVRIEP